MVDYSKKVLHVAVDTKRRGRSWYKVLIFHPANVFSKAAPISDPEGMFNDFFHAHHQYLLVCLETETGPSELADEFVRRLGRKNIGCIRAIGGMIANFTVKPTKFEKIWASLTKKPEQFFRSKEKRIFRRTNISGVRVKV